MWSRAWQFLPPILRRHRLADHLTLCRAITVEWLLPAPAMGSRRSRLTLRLRLGHWIVSSRLQLRRAGNQSTLELAASGKRRDSPPTIRARTHESTIRLAATSGMYLQGQCRNRAMAFV